MSQCDAAIHAALASFPKRKLQMQLLNRNEQVTSAWQMCLSRLVPNRQLQSRSREPGNCKGFPRVLAIKGCHIAIAEPELNSDGFALLALQGAGKVENVCGAHAFVAMLLP